MRLMFGFVLGLHLAASTLTCMPASAKQYYPDSQITAMQQAHLNKAEKYVRARNWNKAQVEVDAIVSQSSNAENGKDLVFAAGIMAQKPTAQSGKLTRVLITAALTRKLDNDSLLDLARYARDTACFDLAKQAYDKLIAQSKSFEELIALANAAHKGGASDMTNLALEKALSLCESQPEALELVALSVDLGADDVARKAMKALADDQDTVQELIDLTEQTKIANMTDVTRFMLLSAMEKCKIVGDYVLVFNAAKKHGQMDIANKVRYRGRKLDLTNKIKQEQGGGLDEVERRAKEDLKRLNASPTGF